MVVDGMGRGGAGGARLDVRPLESQELHQLSGRVAVTFGSRYFPLTFGNKNISSIPMFTWKSVAIFNVLPIGFSWKASNIYTVYILSI